MQLYPSDEFRAQANLSQEDYIKLVQEAQENNPKFWAKLARKELVWQKDFSQTLEKHESQQFKWFSDGELNISENCLDIHLAKNAKKTAIIFEGEPGDTERYSYQELHQEVCRFANLLKKAGIKKADKVAIYMPLCPQTIIAMQACMRLGAIHTVVFGGFSVKALHERIVDAGARLIVTADCIFRKGKTIPALARAYEATRNSPCQKIINYERSEFASKQVNLGAYQAEQIKEELEKTYQEISQSPNLELFSWRQSMPEMSTEFQPQAVAADDDSFILYTSGSTGKPKGIVHRSAGYLLCTKLSSKWVLDLKDSDIYWCTADPGWITGHSYLAYGPLACGATCFMTEAAPNYPSPERFWQMIEKYQITVFYTAPTAIRSFISWGLEHIEKYNLSSLRLLGSVGEPISAETWLWFYQNIGQGRCPIVDTWWQTETGAFMISTLPGIDTMKPGFAGKALPGLKLDINEEGLLHVQEPWPSMLKTVHQNPERYQEAYWSQIKNSYCAGDAALKDSEQYIQITGRVDDVINISGHRLGSAEIEAALVSHPNITEAAVVSSPDPLTGEQINAFVVGKATTTQELQKHVSQEIAAMAKPQKIIFCQSLPKTRSGKIMRRLLKNIAANKETQGDLSTIEDPLVIEQIQKSFRELYC